MEKIIEVFKLVLLVLIFATVVSIAVMLEQLIDEKALRVTEVHHNTTIRNFFGDLPFVEDTKVTIVKGE